MTKKCRVCLIEKSIYQFYKRDSSSDGYDNRCASCVLKYMRNYFNTEDHAVKQRKRISTSKRKRMERIKIKIAKLKDSPCTDCGGKFQPWQMDFDHRDGKLKKNSAFLRELIVDQSRCTRF